MQIYKILSNSINNISLSPIDHIVNIGLSLIDHTSPLMIILLHLQFLKNIIIHKLWSYIGPNIFKHGRKPMSKPLNLVSLITCYIWAWLIVVDDFRLEVDLFKADNKTKLKNAVRKRNLQN